MKVTENLRKWATEKGLAAGATDQQVKDFVAKALASDELSSADYANLQLDRPVGAKAESLSDIVAKQVGAALGPLVQKLAAVPQPEPASQDDAIAKSVNDAVTKAMASFKIGTDTEPTFSGPDPMKMLAGQPGSIGKPGETRIQTVRAIDSYSHTKSNLVQSDKGVSPGMPLMWESRQMETASEADKAVIGAWFKWQANESLGYRNVPRRLRLTDHDRELIKYAMHELAFTGEVSNENGGTKALARQKLTDWDRKAIINDATSGGTYAVPTPFDDAIITTPLLFGELFPMVEVVDWASGNTVQGFSMSNPTFASTAEGSAVSLATTTSFIAAFNTTIFPATAVMEIGLDLEEDAPNNIGAEVAQTYGFEALRWVDEQIAIGDGTTEPQGIFVASGTGSVSSGTGSSGPLDVSDAENLLFSVTAPYRAAKGGRCAFIACETTYKRFRAIPVSTSDQRRVFGMDHQKRMLLDYPFKLQGDIIQSKVAFANLGMYRLYRRRGLQIRVETAGETLARNNCMAIVARMRWGGKLTLGGAAGVMTDAPLH